MNWAGESERERESKERERGGESKERRRKQGERERQRENERESKERVGQGERVRGGKQGEREAGREREGGCRERRGKASSQHSQIRLESGGGTRSQEHKTIGCLKVGGVPTANWNSAKKVNVCLDEMQFFLALNKHFYWDFSQYLFMKILSILSTIDTVF